MTRPHGTNDFLFAATDLIVGVGPKQAFTFPVQEPMGLYSEMQWVPIIVVCQEGYPETLMLHFQKDPVAFRICPKTASRNNDPESARISQPHTKVFQGRTWRWVHRKHKPSARHASHRRAVHSTMRPAPATRCGLAKRAPGSGRAPSEQEAMGRFQAHQYQHRTNPDPAVWQQETRARQSARLFQPRALPIEEVAPHCGDAPAARATQGKQPCRSRMRDDT